MTRSAVKGSAFRWRRGLRAASDGVTAVEFALVAPIFLMMMFGLYDLGQMVFGKIQLQGVVQDAARSSSLETANTAEADAKVLEGVRKVLPGATIESKRQSYYDFTDIARPEKWDDTNKNGTCDNGETFVDENRTGTWEPDVGRDSNGGAGDVVLYTVTVTYKRVFPVPFWGSGAERTMVATAVKKNQPFAAQQALGSSVGKCT